MATTYNNLYLDLRTELRRAGDEEATQSARELVCAAAAKTREELVRDGSLYASPEVEKSARELVKRHLAGEPVAYLIGEWEFYGLPLDISKEVLIPRPDTEVLVDQALPYVQSLGNCRVLDLCAGTGCLGIGIRHFVPSASVTCVEKSPQALQYLQANVHGTGVQAKAADVLQYWRELMPQSVQLIISNPPYLTGAEMQALMPETAHEPAMALDGGTDGLDFYRAIAAHYRDIVCPGGWLVFEIGCAQRADVMEICRQNGWQQVQARKDYGGNDRVVYAQRVK